MADTEALTTDPALVSVVVPVYNEADNIVPLLKQLRAHIPLSHETLLVYDFDEDSTLPAARAFQAEYSAIRLVRNNLGRGVLNALKTGVAQAHGDVVVVTMADLSDDVSQIVVMADKVRAGATVVAGSRYMRGGKQVGGPKIKSGLSRIAGLSLHWITGIGTHDSTNNFKAYDRDFLQSIRIESRSGFELALELTSKAHLSGHTIEEIPTVWRDRTSGASQFKVLQWMPGYLRWYMKCVFGSLTGQRRRARRGR